LRYKTISRSRFLDTATLSLNWVKALA